MVYAFIKNLNYDLTKGSALPTYILKQTEKKNDKTSKNLFISN